jgi:hypothetical protein
LQEDGPQLLLLSHRSLHGRRRFFWRIRTWSAGQGKDEHVGAQE